LGLPGSARSNIPSVEHHEMKSVYKFVLIASIAVAICIYGLFFNRLSETAMVRSSYLWFPGLLFGAVGLKGSQTSPNRPIVVAVIGVVALFLFFELIFPSL
jgi:hypothetical protein